MQRRLDEKNYARTLDVLELPSLIEIQLESSGASSTRA